MILDSAMASKMKNIDHQKTSLFYQEDGFHPKKNFMVSRRNQTLTKTFTITAKVTNGQIVARKHSKKNMFLTPSPLENPSDIHVWKALITRFFTAC